MRQLELRLQRRLRYIFKARCIASLMQFMLHRQVSLCYIFKASCSTASRPVALHLTPIMLRHQVNLCISSRLVTTSSRQVTLLVQGSLRYVIEACCLSSSRPIALHLRGRLLFIFKAGCPSFLRQVTIFFKTDDSK